jgi:hypothetical protein
MRRLLLLVLAFAALGLSACGDDPPETITHGESEAEYVTFGDVQYQVQISRQLNPREVGDRAYLVGIPPADRGLTADEVWFGVWVRAFNRSGQASPTADNFKIVDTRGEEYEPVELQNVNVFAYRPTVIPDEGQYPEEGSAPSETSSTGALLLFKLPVDALSFRPLELEFNAEQTRPASSIVLDV